MFVVVLIVVAVLVIYQIYHAQPYPSGSPLITGARGAGKTRLAMIKMVAKYRSDKMRWRLHKIPLLKYLSPKYEPRVYSNIPLRLTRKDYAYVLKREHLLMREKLPPGASIFFDEIGASINQYSYSDPNIMSDNYIDRFECVEIFVRFFRHFVGKQQGDFVATDQALGDVNVQLRRRFDKALQLDHFRRWLWFTPFYKVNVDELTISEGEIQNTRNVMEAKGERRKYYFGYLPYFDVRHYATHCYALAYERGRFVASVSFDNWRDNPDGLYTDYLIDVRSTEEEQAKYNARKKMISKGLAISK